jgi:hypothetical protein
VTTAALAIDQDRSVVALATRTRYGPSVVTYICIGNKSWAETRWRESEHDRPIHYVQDSGQPLCD